MWHLFACVCFLIVKTCGEFPILEYFVLVNSWRHLLKKHQFKYFSKLKLKENKTKHKTLHKRIIEPKHMTLRFDVTVDVYWVSWFFIELIISWSTYSMLEFFRASIVCLFYGNEQVFCCLKRNKKLRKEKNGRRKLNAEKSVNDTQLA